MGDVRYIIYGARYCPYCNEAENLFESHKLPCVFLDMSEDPEGIQEVKDYYSWETIPVILENNTLTGKTRLVGGFSDAQDELGTPDA